MDGFGRLIPDPSRFPSAYDSSGNFIGLNSLIDYVHSLGLKFGLHVMRGIPRQAVTANTPVFGGAGATASQVANTSSTTPWLNQMYGLQTANSTSLTTGAQAYENSLYGMYAGWGVDFVKVDDMLSTTYHTQEINGVRQAINATGRPMVLSLSPGPAPIAQANHLVANANMWRMTNDMWDNWSDVSQIFSLANQWTPYRGAGHWPDADMLPLGKFLRPPDGHNTTSALTNDEQRTVISLWSMIRSPLIIGSDLPSLDSVPFTKSLLTNPSVLAIDQNSTNNQQVSSSNNKIVWRADLPGSANSRYVGLFNAGSTSTSVSTNFSALGLAAGSYSVTDLWSGAVLGDMAGGLSATLPSHGSGVYLIGPATGVLPSPTWVSMSSGNWNTAGNWSTGTIPNAAGAEADLMTALMAHGTVFSDVPITLGKLVFGNGNGYVLTGAGSLTLSAPSGTAQVVVQLGTQQLDLPTRLATNTVFNVSAGATFIVSDPLTVAAGSTLTQTGSGTVVYQSTVTVESGASVALSQPTSADALLLEGSSKLNLKAGTTATLQVNNLALGSGAIDITDNAIVLNSSDSALRQRVQSALASGYNGGRWDGAGINSSIAAADPRHLAIGYIQQGGQLVVKCTLAGDADLNGVVNFEDLLDVATHFETGDNDWSTGNFNYDPAGLVNLDDLTLLARNYDQPLSANELAQLPSGFSEQWATAVNLANVPEPQAVGLLLGTALLCTARLRCRQRSGEKLLSNF
jgi:hypothetical protein